TGAPSWPSPSVEPWPTGSRSSTTSRTSSSPGVEASVAVHNLNHRLWTGELQPSGCGCLRHVSGLRHAPVEALEVLEGGELDQHSTLARPHLDLHPGVEVSREELLELEQAGRA